MFDLPSMLESNQIKQLRALAIRIEQREITQQDLARATGVDQSQISRILAGNVRRASSNVLKLCKYAETLPALDRDRSTKDSEEAILRVLRGLLGNSLKEDAALAQVVSGLSAWRQTWQEEK